MSGKVRSRSPATGQSSVHQISSQGENLLCIRLSEIIKLNKSSVRLKYDLALTLDHKMIITFFWSLV